MNISSLNRHRFPATIIMLFLCLQVLFSCNTNENQKGAAEKKDNGIHEYVEKGPARVTLETDKKEITIAERINLTIAVDIDI